MKQVVVTLEGGGEVVKEVDEKKKGVHAADCDAREIALHGVSEKQDDGSTVFYGPEKIKHVTVK